jgi:hypothetical protein
MFDNATPAFKAAMADYIRLCNSGQQDSEQAFAALRKLTEAAPPEFKAALEQQAQAMGLIPPATGYLANGTPVWSTQDIAAHHGLPTSQVEAQLEGLAIDIDPAHIHRPQ